MRPVPAINGVVPSVAAQVADVSDVVDAIGLQDSRTSRPHTPSIVVSRAHSGSDVHRETDLVNDDVQSRDSSIVGQAPSSLDSIPQVSREGSACYPLVRAVCNSFTALRDLVHTSWNREAILARLNDFGAEDPEDDGATSSDQTVEDDCEPTTDYELVWETVPTRVRLLTRWRRYLSGKGYKSHDLNRVGYYPPLTEFLKVRFLHVPRDNALLMRMGEVAHSWLERERPHLNHDVAPDWVTTAVAGSVYKAYTLDERLIEMRRALRKPKVLAAVHRDHAFTTKGELVHEHASERRFFYGRHLRLPVKPTNHG